MNGVGDIFELLFPSVLKGDVKLAFGVLSNSGRYADGTGFCHAFEPSRDIDAIPENVAPVEYDVPNIYPDTKLGTAV
jgi:hypothetical protein